MKIVIPSRGRWARQTTLDNLPLDIVAKTTVVVPHKEVSQYQTWNRCSVDIVAEPARIGGIADKRQWIVENFGPKVCMLDDDLVFAMRRSDDLTKFRPALPEDIRLLFTAIEDLLEQYAHVGVSGREGANRKTDGGIEIGRMSRILAYRTEVLKNEGVRFDDVHFMEDFHVTLSLLEKGYMNCIVSWMVQNQNGSNAEGGCSTIRTDEGQAAAARRLAFLHPRFVTVVKKTTKTAWGGKEREDVRVQWKEAYKSAGTT
jgi:hypothetical protein